MTFVTLTTDFGYTDYYVALLKGAILTQAPQSTCLDVTHSIPPHDIVEGAFALKNVYAAFPKGTLHVLSVNTFYGEKNSFLVFKKDDFFFLGPDNGIFSLVFEALPQEMYRLPVPDHATFPLREIVANVVRHLEEELPLDKLGEAAEEIVQRLTLQPVISPSQIRGSVIHIDHYGNVLVNIRRTLFEEVGHGRKFSLFFKRHDPIQQLRQTYCDVPVGEPLCLFNAAGYLEIAINAGQAATLFGLNIDDTVQIDFHNM